MPLPTTTTVRCFDFVATLSIIAGFSNHDDAPANSIASALRPRPNLEVGLAIRFSFRLQRDGKSEERNGRDRGAGNKQRGVPIESLEF